MKRRALSPLRRRLSTGRVALKSPRRILDSTVPLYLGIIPMEDSKRISLPLRNCACVKSSIVSVSRTWTRPRAIAIHMSMASLFSPSALTKKRSSCKKAYLSSRLSTIQLPTSSFGGTKRLDTMGQLSCA